MSEAILVTYATRGGSTREVADAVAATLRTQGLKAEVRPVQSVESILPYTAVVLGAPIYYGHWHKDMLTFLAQHTVALITRPVAIFALGPIQPDPEEMKAAKVVIDKALAQFQWLTPVAGEVFVGRYDPSSLNPFERLLLKLPGSPVRKISTSDQRDWAAIRAWAESLALTLKPLVVANA
jgi:menaquinone-dependent protoporphyrinogen oxidase